MILRFPAFAVVIFSLFVACETLGPQEELPPCAEMDWYELGRSDGVRGQSNLQWQGRVANCSAFDDDLHRSYLNGWYSGVDEFCSPEHGYIFGRSGHAYFAVCPRDKEPPFLAAYQKGIKVFLFENSNKKINEEIRDIELKIVKMPSLEKAKLSQKLKKLQKAKAKNRASISKIETEMSTRKL